jgi:hypothetical protein
VCVCVAGWDFSHLSINMSHAHAWLALAGTRGHSNNKGMEDRLFKSMRSPTHAHRHTTHTHTHTQTYIHIYIHTHTYIHAYIHTCARSREEAREQPCQLRNKHLVVKHGDVGRAADELIDASRTGGKDNLDPIELHSVRLIQRALGGEGEETAHTHTHTHTHTPVGGPLERRAEIGAHLFVDRACRANKSHSE